MFLEFWISPNFNNSFPVDIIPIFGFRLIVTHEFPDATQSEIFLVFNTSPLSISFSPNLKSIPNFLIKKLFFSNLFLLILIKLLPSLLISSWRITLSAPWGIFAPVNILTVCIVATVFEELLPATLSSITVNSSTPLSISEFFKAYPSIEETSDGGLDNKAVTGFANVFPNEFKTISSWDDNTGIFFKIVEVAFSTEVSFLFTFPNPFAWFSTCFFI